MYKYRKINFDLWIVKFISALLPLLINIYLYFVSGNILKLTPATVISELYFIAIILSLDSLHVTSIDDKKVLFYGASTFIILSSIAYGHIINNNIREKLSFFAVYLAILLFAGCLTINLFIQHKNKAYKKPGAQKVNEYKESRSYKNDKLLLAEISRCENECRYDDAFFLFDKLSDKYKNSPKGMRLKRELTIDRNENKRFVASFTPQNTGAQEHQYY